MVTSGVTSFPAVLVAWQRDRDILVQRLEYAYSHVTNVTIVGVVAQNRPPCVSGVIFAVIAFSHSRHGCMEVLLLYVEVLLPEVEVALGEPAGDREVDYNSLGN